MTLQGLLPTLTRTDRAIAELLLDYRPVGERAWKLSDVAVRAGVSESAVVKFAKRLGLSGFRHLKRVLDQYERMGLVDLHEELSDVDDGPTVVRKVFGTAVQAIQDTQAILDYPTFERAAAILADANHVVVYGLGGSAVIGQDFEHKMLRIGKFVRAHCDTHMMAMSASLLSDVDVALAISHSGASAGVVEAMELAGDAGAETIAVTNVPKSPITRAARLVLLSASQGSPITGENAASRIAQLNILDALFVRVSQTNRSAALRSLERTMGSVARKRYT